LQAKCKTELAEQFVRTKVKKEKQKNIKAIHKTMYTANMLQMLQLYQSFGDKGKVREILVSDHNGMNKLDTSPKEEDNDSDKENVTMMSKTKQYYFDKQ
jgi:hypothetical protein